MEYYSSMEQELDEKDLAIIDCLKENGRQSVYKIAKKTGLPPTTVHNRIKKLENDGVITGYAVKLNRKKIGRPICVYILINHNMGEMEKTGTSLEEIRKKLFAIGGMQEVAYITGEFDIIAKVYLKDVDELNETILHKLMKLPGIKHTETILAMQYFEK